MFANGFGSISDMKIGPDGALYILTFTDNSRLPIENQTGSLYRIAENTIDLPFVHSQTISADHLGLVGMLAVIVAILVFVKFHRLFRLW